MAVVLLAGRADQLVPCLTTSPAFDWNRLPAGRLHRYRWLDHDEVLDDVLIHRYPTTEDHWAVEISTHGGPRIVQRLLMQLRDQGVEVAPAERLSGCQWPEIAGLQAEALALLPQSHTRKMASWLVSNAHLLTEEIGRLLEWSAEQRFDAAARALNDLLDRGMPGRRVLDTLRVVLIGEPNAGKSTLANALAEHDRAIVSDVPGTTRDWTEHPLAIQGIPFLLVDTAGLRTTDDAVEHLAVQRARSQWSLADLVLRVIDGTAAPTPAEAEAVEASGNASSGARPLSADLFLWNKSDQPMHTDQGALQQKLKGRSLKISAQTGGGLDRLRSTILEISGYLTWPAGNPELFSPRQIEICRYVLSELAEGEAAAACSTLRKLLNFTPEDTPA